MIRFLNNAVSEVFFSTHTKSYMLSRSVCTKNNTCFRVNSLSLVFHVTSWSSTRRAVLPERAALWGLFSMSVLFVGLFCFEERPQTTTAEQ